MRHGYLRELLWSLLTLYALISFWFLLFGAFESNNCARKFARITRAFPAHKLGCYLFEVPK